MIEFIYGLIELAAVIFVIFISGMTACVIMMKFLEFLDNHGLI